LALHLTIYVGLVRTCDQKYEVGEAGRTTLLAR